MAFNNNTAARNTNAQSDDWKAQGFLNLSLPSKSGTLRKLGAIPLRGAKPNEKEMCDWLMEDPTRVASILSKLVITFQPATQSAGAGFDLS